MIRPPPAELAALRAWTDIASHRPQPATAIAPRASTGVSSLRLARDVAAAAGVMPDSHSRLSERFADFETFKKFMNFLSEGIDKETAERLAKWDEYNSRLYRVQKNSKHALINTIDRARAERDAFRFTVEEEEFLGHAIPTTPK